MTIRANSIVTGQELNDIFEQTTQKAEGTGFNQYDIYIQECKANEGEKFDSAGQRLSGVEKHHITPRFDGGTDEPSNLVFLTVKEHAIAHWLRFKVLGKRGDNMAFLFRIGDTDEALEQRLAAIREARERDRATGQGFFDSNFQSTMGSRGGAIGGARNTPAQFEARRRVGQAFGRQTGVNNQKPHMREFLSKSTIWSYSRQAAEQGRGASRSDAVFFLVSPKAAFIDVALTLELFVPGSIPFDTVTSMHKLVAPRESSNYRPQMYGWKIVETLTRSEVREGVERFKKNNPLASFSTEEDNTIFE